ncbi:hypothetical protein CHS0354_030480 [Potamilus streckersoni]|uniref:Poly [ADP-ribose] polymerase n=1 Tax=Potamilus streckersoni TaxID=2493646 RepID=A0AAE0RPH8_9BIVA|nr:hypothetical protein CHS0354_030480 [Potamilus streckersoni]
MGAKESREYVLPRAVSLPALRDSSDTTNINSRFGFIRNLFGARSTQQPRPNFSLRSISEQNLQFDSPGPMAEAESEGKFVKFGNIKVYVVKNNLANETADIFVCSVPSSLDLSLGRAAKSLEKESGDSLQAECNSKYPNGIRNGEIAVINPGNLNCKNVFFITLPRWDSNNAQEIDKITNECLEKANQMRFISMATLALGTGYLEYPADTVATTMFNCIENFSSSTSHLCLQTIKIVVHSSSKEILKAFKSEARKRASNLETRSSSSSSLKTGVSKTYKEGNMEIKICLGKLANWKADVLVSSGSTDLQLSNGYLSSSLLEKAGSELQDECDEKYPIGIQHGEVAVTNGYNLQCNKVYHGSLPPWDETQDKKELGIFVDECLRLADRYRVQSIAFPALGTGALKYPAKHSATTLHRCIKTFVKDNPTSSIKQIYIVIYNEGINWKRIKQDFTDEFSSCVSSSQPVREHKVPKQRPPSLHPRGSKEYFTDLYNSDIYPPCYWTHYKNSKSVKQWNADTKEPTKPMFIPVDQDTFNQIKKVVELTWQKEFVGHGKDAKGLQNLNYTRIVVTKVERIENIHVFEKYANYRQIFFKAGSKQGQVTPFNDIKGLKKGPLKTTATILGSSVLAKDIYPEINEHYLFHGTKEVVVESIATQGLDDRLAENAMFGKGVYCAESSTKADQYADDKQRRSDGEKKMLLVRACLGEVYLESTSTAHQRPPCRQCKQDKCINHGTLYDSVVGEGSWNFREFVLYESMQVYPEYLITYRRA